MEPERDQYQEYLRLEREDIRFNFGWGTILCVVVGAFFAFLYARGRSPISLVVVSVATALTGILIWRWRVNGTRVRECNRLYAQLPADKRGELCVILERELKNKRDGLDATEPMLHNWLPKRGP